MHIYKHTYMSMYIDMCMDIYLKSESESVLIKCTASVYIQLNFAQCIAAAVIIADDGTYALTSCARCRQRCQRQQRRRLRPMQQQ